VVSVIVASPHRPGEELEFDCLKVAAAEEQKNHHIHIQYLEQGLEGDDGQHAAVVLADLETVGRRDGAHGKQIHEGDDEWGLMQVSDAGQWENLDEFVEGVLHPDGLVD